MCIVAYSLIEIVPQGRAQTGGQAPSYYSLQLEQPPLPFNWTVDLGLDLPVYEVEGMGNAFAVDDRSVDYEMLSLLRSLETMSIAPPCPGGEDCEGEPPGGGTQLQGYNYPSNVLWIEIRGVTNDVAYLTMHNTSNTTYQLQRKLTLNDPYWIPGEVITGNGGNVDFSPLPVYGQPMMFFRAIHSQTTLRFQLDLESESETEIKEPNSLASDLGNTTTILAVRDGPTDSDLTVYYRVAGFALNGVDFTNLSGVVTIPSGQTSAGFTVRPIEDQLPEFDETADFFLMSSNYMVDTNHSRETITIFNNPRTNVFEVIAVATNALGMDYYSPSNLLIVSVNAGAMGEPFNFLSIATNLVVSNSLPVTNVVVGQWSSIRGMEEEVKIATVKVTTNGFTAGELFFGNNGTTNTVGKVFLDGSVATNWAVLTNDTFIRGSLYVDQTGVFDHDLIAVTGSDELHGGGVWRVNASGVATRVANLTNNFHPHLEGVITLPGEPLKWGPWAGKIVAGAESALPKPLIYAIADDGSAAEFEMGIEPEDFDLIPPNQHLYCAQPAGGPDQNGVVTKLPQSILSNNWDDLLVTQAGENPLTQNPRLFIIRWDPTNFVFFTQSFSSSNGNFEHVTFAPVSIPKHP